MARAASGRLPLVLLALAAGALPVGLGAQQPSFPVSVERVRLDVVVLDRDGQPAQGLQASDFELLEDGRPQTIQSFEAVSVRGRVPAAVEVPRAGRQTPADGSLFVLFYDDLHLPPWRTVPARDAIRRFLAEGARPGDRVTIVAPGQGVWWTARLDEEGRGDLLAVADGLRGRRLRGSGPLDYQALLVHQRGDEGFLERSLPGSQKARAAEAAAQALQAARQAARPDGTIPAPPSILARAASADLVGMGDSMRVAEMEAEYAEGARLNRLTLEALRDVVASLALVPGRKSLVLVSEGIVDDPELGDLARVVARAGPANAVVYFLDVRGGESFGGSGYEAAQPGGPGPAMTEGAGSSLLRRLGAQGASLGSERLADETGGRTIRSNDLAGGLQRIAAEAHSYYLLGYSPADGSAGGFRKTQLRVRRPGLTVRARPGWRPAGDPAGAAAPVAAVTTPAAAPAAPASDALGLLARSGADLLDVPVAVSTYVFDAPAPGLARVVLAADVDLPPAPSGTPLSYRLLVVPLGAGGGLEHAGDALLPPSAQPPWAGGFGTHAPLAREFQLPPGRYQVRLAVEVAGRYGAATSTFAVPPLAGLRVSNPIVTDGLQDRSDRAPRPVVRGLRAFWSNATLYCQFEVFGSPRANGAPAVIEAGYAVHGADGSVARAVPATRIEPGPDGRLLRLFGFPLSALAPGSYTMSVEVRDVTGGTMASAATPFRVLALRR